jgi:transposase InsO family protein
MGMVTAEALGGELDVVLVCAQAALTRNRFTGKALDQWAYRNGVELKLIQPGKLMHNAYVKSFNGKFPGRVPERALA